MRRRCCCNLADFRFLTARGAPCPYGRIRIYNAADALVLDAVAGDDGRILVPLPSSSVTGWKFNASDVPRSAAYTVGPTTLQAGWVYFVRIGATTRYVPSEGPGYSSLYLGPLAGYGVLPNLEYPQVTPLTLDDSTYGSISLAWSALTASVGAYTHVPAGGGYPQFRFASSAFSTPLYSLVASSYRKADLADRHDAYAAPSAMWSPSGGGAFAWSVAGTRWGAAYTQAIHE